MHGDDEFGDAQSSLLVSVRQSPYPAQCLVWKTGSFKDGSRGFACMCVLADCPMDPISSSCLPERAPFWAPDRSKRPEYC